MTEEADEIKAPTPEEGEHPTMIVTNGTILEGTPFKTVEDLKKGYKSLESLLGSKANEKDELLQQKEALSAQVEELQKATTQPEEYMVPGEVGLSPEEINKLKHFASESQLTQVQFEKALQKYREDAINTRSRKEAQEAQLALKYGKEKVTQIKNFIRSYYPAAMAANLESQLDNDAVFGHIIETRTKALQQGQLITRSAPGKSRDWDKRKAEIEQERRLKGNSFTLQQKEIDYYEEKAHALAKDPLQDY